MGEVTITVRMDDTTGRIIGGTVRNLGELERQGQRNKRVADDLDRSWTRQRQSLMGVTNTIERGAAVLSRYQVSQINVTTATERRFAAEQRLIDAQERHGAASRQALAASRELEAARRAEDEAHRAALLTIGLTTVQVFEMGVGIVNTARHWAAYTRMTQAATGATVAMNTALLASPWGILAAGAAVAVGAILMLPPSTKQAQGGLSEASAAAEVYEQRLEAIRQRSLDAAAAQDVVSAALAVATARWKEAAAAAEQAERAAGTPPAALGGDVVSGGFEEQTAARHRAAAREQQEAADLRQRNALAIQRSVEAANEAAAQAARRAAGSRFQSVAAQTFGMAGRRDVAGLQGLQQALATELGAIDITQDPGRWQAVSDALGEVNSALNSIATDGARAVIESLEQADEKLAKFQQRALDMSEVGVNLTAFSGKFRAEMDALSKSIHDAGGSEDDFNAAALKSSKALRDQTEITAFKDETTEDFHKRLKALGFTEQELALRLDETGRALRRQTDETKAAAEATQHRIGGAANPLMRTILSQGLLGDGTAQMLFDFLDQNPERWRDPRLGGVLGVLESASRGASYHPGTIARMLQGIVSADSGFHGMLGRDTLFLAHRGERVDIDRPSRMPSGGLNIGTVVVQIHGAGGSPGSIEREVTRGVRQGLASARGRA